MTESINCPICIDEIDFGSKQNGCRGGKKDGPLVHIFHDCCIKEWAEKSNTCPVCRSSLDLRNVTAGPASTGQTPSSPITGPSVLSEAAIDGDVETVERLIEGLDESEVSKIELGTALNVATLHGYLDVVAILLTCSPYQRDIRNAIDVALSNGNTDMEEVLRAGLSPS